MGEKEGHLEDKEAPVARPAPRTSGVSPSSEMGSTNIFWVSSLCRKVGEARVGDLAL